jgi:hypothetical protein
MIITMHGNVVKGNDNIKNDKMGLKHNDKHLK